MLFSGNPPRSWFRCRNSVGAVENPANVRNLRTPHVSAFEAAKIRSGDPSKSQGAHCILLSLREQHGKWSRCFYYYIFFIMKTKFTNSETGWISSLFYSEERTSKIWSWVERKRMFKCISEWMHWVYSIDLFIHFEKNLLIAEKKKRPIGIPVKNSLF